MSALLGGCGWKQHFESEEKSVKLWPKIPKSETSNLPFVWPPTCIDLRRAQIHTQVDARFLAFGHPTQGDTS